MRKKLILEDLRREAEAKKNKKKPNIYIEDGVVICDEIDESFINQEWLHLTEEDKKFIEEVRARIKKGEKI